MARRAVLSALLFATLLPGIAPPPAAAQSAPVVIYLVRHAERAEDGTNDPPISQAGQARAETLATLLRDAGITQLHTTDFARTRQTGAPLAQALGLGLQVYDPRDLQAFADRLRTTPGRHVVFGHSNTTPALVEALGGEPHGAIDEMEYDRLYVVVLPEDGPAATVLLRFGAPYHP